MIKNYFIIAWRNLWRHKLFSFINILGLASGMSVCMLAIIKIKQAYDYDVFHPNSTNTYRIITNLSRKNGDHFMSASSPLALSAWLKENYPSVEKGTSVFFSNDEIKANDKILSARQAYVDPDFFSIFGFELAKGSPAISPNSAVITRETAKRFFGNENVIGRSLTIGGSDTYLITGILKKPDYPSHLNFDVLASSASVSLKSGKVQGMWTDEAPAYTYIQLKPGTTVKGLQDILENVNSRVKSFIPPSSEKQLVFKGQAIKDISPGTIPMKNLTDEPVLPNLAGFALIGFCMLMLAFFNYVNLTLARSLDRGREIGIRKVAGALRIDILRQFLSESVLVACFSFFVAWFLLKWITKLTVVQNMIGNAPHDHMLWLYFSVFTILTGLVAGWIPARIFSSFHPARVLKGMRNAKLFGSTALRKTLIVIQFACSLIAIFILSIFYKQSVYMASSDYGFNKERIINVPIPDQSYEISSATIRRIAGVEEVSGTSGLFGFSPGATKFIRHRKNDDSIAATCFSVTPSFIKSLGLQLVSGENLPDEAENGTIIPVLLNEEACRVLKYKNPSEAIGKLLWLNDSTQYFIKGVLKDFHYSGFLHPIGPLLLVNNGRQFKFLNLKVAKGAESSAMVSLAAVWKNLYPNQPFEAEWFHKQLMNHHLNKDDLLFTGLLTIFALLIACLGLLGMVICITRNRSKEISIRRVMGAGVVQVMGEVSKEFITLLAAAVLTGLPFAIIIGTQFLQQYAYRIPINFSLMISSAVIIIAIGAFTISWQVYQVSRANPVRSLRLE